MDPAELWRFLPFGYLFSIAIETPVLMVGLSARHSMKVRIFSGFWLTACTYPIVVLVMPQLLSPRWLYLLVAETFAPAAECALFWLAFGSKEEWGKKSFWRDMITITLANLASFGGGELMYWLGWWDWLFPPVS
jgi:hypothetical protein